MTDPTDILYVEDNANDAELTLRALRRINLANRLHWVKDGAEALDYLFGTRAYADAPINPLKLVLLDIKLPKVDGIEVLARIRADERTRLTPVVMLTSSAEERDVIDSYKLGVNSYLTKPVDFARFVETVSQAGLYWIGINRNVSPKSTVP